MAIARKKPEAPKTPKSPTKVAKDAGLSSVKPPTKKSIQEAAKAEKAKASQGKPGKMEKFIMAAVPETEEIFMGTVGEDDTPIETTKKKAKGKTEKGSKTPKNKSEDSQKGENDTIVQKPPKAQGKDPKDEAREKRTRELLETCQGYAGSLVQKSRYKGIDPNKLVFAAFLAIPKHKETEQ